MKHNSDRSINWTKRSGVTRRILALSLFLLMLGIVVASLPVPALADEAKDAPRAHPALLQMAKERPSEKLKVIVQRRATEKLPPQALENLNVKVKKDLKIINGFAAELPGKAVEALARSPGVRWVSLDAPLVSTAMPNGFGAGGKVSMPFGSDNDYGNAVAIQQDNKIVVAGSVENSSGYDIAVARFNPNGSLDTSFDGDGKVTTSVSTNDDYAQAVAVQPDGKIVVAGYGKVGSYHDIVLVRYNADGSLDTTFDGDGKVTTAVGSRDDIARALAIQPDGKIVVAGYTYVSASNDDTVVLRYNANGSLDTTFDGDGKVVTAVGGTNRDRAYAIALQSDGKIVVAGSRYNFFNDDISIVRYNANGSLDTTFGSNGKVATDFGDDDVAYGVALQSDGKIVVAGARKSAGYYDIAVLRYNTNGSLDTTFDGDGKVVTSLGGANDYGRAVVLQSDGKIVVVGDGTAGSTVDLVALRYNTNGSLDTTFDGDGIAIVAVGGGTDIGNAAALQADGRLVIVGQSYNGANYDIALARINSDGGPDCADCVDAGRLANAYNRAVGADRLWNGTGYRQGQGVTVAVVDSGISAHNDLKTVENNSRIVASSNQTASPDANDGFGHGTHVAGIIGGDGGASVGGRMGVAPKVNLVNVKVSGDDGMSLASDLIDGLQWINDNRATYNIRVVNISLNSTVAEPYHACALCAATEILWFNGIVVVVSAGNNGTGTGPVTLYPPANDPFVITVGATDDMGTAGLGDDTVTVWSAYGTTESYFAKPDLVAPGRNVISLLAGTGARIYTEHPTHRVDDAHFRMSGTSMAAPVVSGVVALLLQDEPSLNPNQVKYRLKATANAAWASYNAAKAGAGYVDAYAAVSGTTTQSANTGIVPSLMLWTGTNPPVWDSVNWSSVNWSSVNWSSVNWSSVNWSSVNWSSVLWDP